MQMGFVVDQSRCTGCFTCVLACKDWHESEIEPDEVANWRRVVSVEKGTFPNVGVTYYSVSCLHCAKPVCVGVCPAGAISKRLEDGIVLVDREMCWGIEECGGLCQEACPYNAPQFSKQKDAKMQKCDLCYSSSAERKKPVCVEACPLRALDFVAVEEFKGKNDYQSETGGFEPSDCIPSIVFKVRKQKLLNI